MRERTLFLVCVLKGSLGGFTLILVCVVKGGLVGFLEGGYQATQFALEWSAELMSMPDICLGRSGLLRQCKLRKAGLGLL